MEERNVSTDWSLLNGREWGEIWAGVDAADYAELVEWSDPECLDRNIPLPNLARQYLPDVLEEAEEQVEEFNLNAFERVFLEVVQEARRTSEPGR